ncbi:MULTISPECIES: copper-binding protein [Sodalis]|uniref:Cu(I)/Ag(I) efflux system protein CusF n=1 Tax=Sodalis ligni TaxID=2697027 RepID=A0A4R1NFQ2_9GAMM|nr:Cu(I)/Ag(I) efflux system protein CusF [Sodalis ligni]
MRALLIVVLSAFSLFNLPAFADDMAAMGDMPGMQHDHGMMTAADAAASDYHSQGIIKLWDSRHVAIAHHAIPALNWPPMTMTFAVPPAFAGQKLAVGTQVDFSFRQDAQGYQLTAIHPVQP